MVNLQNQNLPLQGFEALESFRKNIAEIKKNIENSNHPRFPMTFLIDDCHHSFGPSERQPIVALLNCGADANARYSHGREEYFVVGPKAFAGNTGLPASLASRCIPIVSHRRKVDGASLKGYRLQDFQDAWERYAGLVAISRDHENSIATS